MVARAPACRRGAPSWALALALCAPGVHTGCRVALAEFRGRTVEVRAGGYILAPHGSSRERHDAALPDTAAGPSAAALPGTGNGTLGLPGERAGPALDGPQLASSAVELAYGGPAPAPKEAPRQDARRRPQTRLGLKSLDAASLECRRSVFAPDLRPGGTTCPEECGYWAEVMTRGSTDTCIFQCVQAVQCGILPKLSVDHVIADKKLRTCRSCRVNSCLDCTIDGDGTESCLKCGRFYDLVDGACVDSLRFLRLGIEVVGGIFGVYFLLWYFRLRCTDYVNEEGVEQGLRFRSHSKLHMPRVITDGSADRKMTGTTASRRTTEDATSMAQTPTAPTTAEGGDAMRKERTAQPSPVLADGEDAYGGSEEVFARRLRTQVGVHRMNTDSPYFQDVMAGGDAVERHRTLWPLSTNLLKVPVGGPGMTLHFNFQFFLIVWASGIVVAWVATFFWVGQDFDISNIWNYLAGSSLSAATTPPVKICQMLNWSTEWRESHVFTKSKFLLFAYIATFASSIAFSISQRRRYQDHVSSTTTMRDYAAFCEGIPAGMPGAEQVERQLQAALAEGTGERVVGVSVCWDFTEKEAQVERILENASLGKDMYDLPPRTGWGNLFRPLDAAMEQVCSLAEGSAAESMGRPEDLLRSLRTSQCAFVVFATEAARDTAIEKSAKVGGFPFRDEPTRLRLRKVDREPGTVNWANFGEHQQRLPARIAKGIFAIVLTLALWVSLVYVPYAYYLASYSITHGDGPEWNSAFRILFMVIVVLGNQIMYAVCMAASEFMGFTNNDDKEVAYVIAYTIATFFNVLLDMGLTYVLAYYQMVGIDKAVHAGVYIDEQRWYDMNSLHSLFEATTMQDILGNQLFAYAFPACFLVPYLCEPLFMVLLPFHLQRLWVGSTPGLVGRRAEKAMNVFVTLDLGRYADVMLNTIIVALIFLVPSEYTLDTFLGFILSHIFIYFWDHFRVLRAVPSFCYASGKIEYTAQALLALPCAVILFALIWKSDCLQGGPYCLNTGVLWLGLGAMGLHILLHLALLNYVVPRFGRPEQPVSQMEYSQVARVVPCTWFTANPVHCLRSTYFHRHNPPCGFYMRGREHLLQANPDIGCYFEEPHEEYSEESYWTTTY